MATTRRSGKPISCGVQRSRPSEEGDGEPVRFVDRSEWLEKWQRDATAFFRELEKQSKLTIREVLIHLQRVQMQGDISVNGLSRILQVSEPLLANKTKPPQHHFFARSIFIQGR